MNITLTRAHKKLNVTMGMLSIDGMEHEPLHTLELPWRDNKRTVSCIPTGVYQVYPHVSPSLGKCWKLQDVPERDDILIHSGNTVEDIRGCILLGLSAAPMAGDPAVTKSRGAISYFRTLVGEKPFTLKVV